MCTHTKITETGAKRLVFGVLCPLSPAVRWWFQTVDDFSLGMVDVLVFWVHCVALKTRVLHDNCLTLDTFTQKLKTHYSRQRRMNIIQHLVLPWFWVIIQVSTSAFSAMTLLVDCQEEHLACKKLVMRCWHCYLMLMAPHHLLLQ